MRGVRCQPSREGGGSGSWCFVGLSKNHVSVVNAAGEQDRMVDFAGMTKDHELS